MSWCRFSEFDPFSHPGLHLEVDDFGSGLELNSVEAVEPDSDNEGGSIVSSSTVYEDVFILFVEDIEEIDGEVNGVEIDEFGAAADTDFSGNDVLMSGSIEVGGDVKDGFDISGLQEFMVEGIVSITEP
jgi:hypothetical protein